MLQKVEGLPDSVVGLEAHGKLTREDYEKVLTPLMDELDREGKPTRVLCRIPRDFTGLTPGAMFDDVRLGLRYQHLIERFALVSDFGWMRRSVGLVSPLVPYPLRAFGEEQMAQAVDWLEAPPRGSLHAEMRQGVLLVEPQGPLGVEDFERLASLADPWIREHGKLRGLVVHFRRFPGWKTLGGFLRHALFVLGHRDKIERIAVIADGRAAKVLPRLAGRLVPAEVEAFPEERLGEALAWAAGAQG